MKVSRRRLWKTVFMHESQHAFQNAVQLQWMLDRVGWGGGWMNILGVFNMLWHNFEINKPMIELVNTVRFTEYLKAIFKSFPPNIYISTSASRFADTYIIDHTQPLARMEACVQDAKAWLCDNGLVMNDNKSQATVIRSSSLRTPTSLTRVNICGQLVDTSPVIWDLGFTIDTNLTMTSQVANVCRSA